MHVAHDENQRIISVLIDDMTDIREGIRIAQELQARVSEQTLNYMPELKKSIIIGTDPNRITFIFMQEGNYEQPNETTY